MDKFENKFANFKNALVKLKEAAIEVETKRDNAIIRDGLIQRFEFTYELAWKTTKEYLEGIGIVDINSPRIVLKEAFAQKLISDEDIWLAILKDRNYTAHVYNEELSIAISNRIINQYISQFDMLVSKIEDNLWLL